MPLAYCQSLRPDASIQDVTSPHTEAQDMTFGEALGRVLRKLREAHRPRVSQAKVARDLEMTVEAIGRLERGRGTTTATVQRYLDAIGATWEDVLGPRSGGDDGIGWLSLAPSDLQAPTPAAA